MTRETDSFCVWCALQESRIKRDLEQKEAEIIRERWTRELLVWRPYVPPPQHAY